MHIWAVGPEQDWLGCAGVVDCRAGTGSVELRRYAKDHPFAQLQGSDNIIAFTTQRYASQPLIVRYPTLYPIPVLLFTCTKS